MASSEDLICEKESRLIDAVLQNNVDQFKDLLDSPKWYNITDKEGYNLLQSAIVNNRKEVFDYLLSLPDYPLEFENKDGRTALQLVLDYPWTEEGEYFACELIKKGACINKISSGAITYPGDTLLHSACHGGFVNASMLLIEKGIDVNVCGSNGHTPLQRICRDRRCDFMKRTEIILMLLEFGADTLVRDDVGYTPFDISVDRGIPNDVQNALFYYTYDEFSLLEEIHLEILLKLAAKNSPLFYEITKRQLEIIDTNESNIKFCLKNLFFINATNLKILFTKFDKSFKTFFTQPLQLNVDIPIALLSIEKLNILIESSVKDEIINIIIPLICSCLLRKICYIQNKSKVTEYLCYLLSYGIEISEFILHLIYENFGYCDLFKILLHMDIKNKTYSCSNCVLPSLLINVNQTLEDFLKNNENLSSDQLKELMSYFVHPKLHFMYRQAVPEGSINAPKIPSLLELSRNVFRSYFVDKFQIKTSSQFYTILNCLKISPDNKQIITYETKLYSI